MHNRDDTWQNVLTMWLTTAVMSFDKNKHVYWRRLSVTEILGSIQRIRLERLNFQIGLNMDQLSMIVEGVPDYPEVTDHVEQAEMVPPQPKMFRHQDIRQIYILADSTMYGKRSKGGLRDAAVVQLRTKLCSQKLTV